MDSDGDEPKIHEDSIFSWLKGRELGRQRKKSFRHKTRSEAFNRISNEIEHHIWKTLGGLPTQGRFTKMHTCQDIDRDGVFGLKYSPDGKVLVAACERKVLSVIDPMTKTVIKNRENAHSDCCNNLTFIDEKIFASTSDDCKVGVWDLRNLSKEVFMLKGHRHWVKNVEYHRPSKLLVSSGFDNRVISWDLNSVGSENEIKPTQLLKVKELLRMRLSPDGESMYLTSTDVWDVIAIHNLHISSIANDIGHVTSVLEPMNFSVKTRNGLLSSRRRITDDRQRRPFKRKNHLDVYTCSFSESVACHSLDVHPQNSAVLLSYRNSTDKITAVHNTWTSYPAITKDPLEYGIIPRGIATNILENEPDSDDMYIEEVCFSSCGRLIASPFGYGVTLATYDQCFNHYDAHMMNRLTDIPKDQDSFEDGAVLPKRTKVEEPDCEKTTSDSQLRKIKPIPCHVIKSCFGHRSAVLSTCFSPTHMQLATGCRQGKILLHDPVL